MVDPEKLELGLAELGSLGFEPVLASNLLARDGLFAGSDEERLRGLHDLALDPSLSAIVFARGGHGALRLLPRIDWSALAAVPRAYVGYSDLTPFLLQVVERLGLVAFHGPMIAADFARGLSGDERESFLRTLAGEAPLTYPAQGVAGGSGEARGRLLGGCLSLLTATLGTPYATDFDGSLLFWEEVGEPLYRIDRMLTHLRLSGSLRAVRGAIIGRVRGIDEAADSPSDVPRRMAEHAPDVPVLWGVPAGHEAPNWTLPLGMPARIDGESARLIVEEGASARGE
ncbi:MAG: LD-carboxypeptidase [Holophagales bacterium]|nr:LD-carboxypeptidase [Holophagales bacterium]